MAKLSSADLKEMIGQWLSTLEARQKLSWHYFRSSSSSSFNRDDAAAAVCYAELFNMPVGSSPEDVNERMLQEFADPSKWKRESKQRAQSSDEATCEDVIERFEPDVVGLLNEQRITSLGDAVGSCWCRTFTPKHETLADNFRLEVLTTPDDSEVIAWSVIVD